MSSTYNIHLSLKDRKSIEEALNNGATRTSIADILGKNKSTICKEVKARRYVFIRGYDKGVIRDCIHLTKCGYKVCTKPCRDYQRIRCSYRDRKVGVCNGCEDFVKCNKTKYLYKAQKAHDEYRKDLVDSREGVNLTTSQAKQLGDFLKPLIDNGQSLYTIVRNHPALELCEKSLYNYLT
jgi:IS30 family transposase